MNTQTNAEQSQNSAQNNTTSNLQTHMGSTEKRALELLGANWGPELVAQTLGVTPAYISQLLAKDDFKDAVQARRFVSLQKHSDHDSRLDRMEHKIAENLEKNIPFLMKPQDQMRALQVINNLKRKGSVDTGSGSQSAPTVTLLMPVSITQKFTTNINNQVINAGGQVLETIQSSTLMKQAKEQITRQQERLVLDASVVERNQDHEYSEVRSSESASTGENPDDF